MDLRPLFASCISGNAEEVARELDQLNRAASRSKNGRLIDNVEIAYNVPQALEALRAFEHLASRPASLALEQLLTHAVRYVPYYKNTVGELQNGTAPSLTEFPPLSRAEIAIAAGDFYASNWDIAATCAIHPTSGTTGTPLVVWIPPAMFFDICYALYSDAAELVGGTIDQISAGQCSVVQLSEHPRTWAGQTHLIPLKLSVLRRIMFQPDPKEALRIIKDLNPAILSGTVSTLSTFLSAVTPSSVRSLSPSLLLLSGEKCYPDQQRKLEKAFNCPCLDAYVSSEGGAIAVSYEEAGEAVYHVRSHAVWLEVLTSSGEIVEDGTGEILVSNLLNHAMPLIRYRTGDYGTISTCKRNRTQQLTAFSGKDLACYHIDGADIETAVITALLQKKGLTEFRLSRDSNDAAGGDFTLTYCRSDQAAIDQGTSEHLSMLLGGANLLLEPVERVSSPGKKTVRFS